MDDLLFIECVSERDVDLLLLEELHVSQAFRDWLLGQVLDEHAPHRFIGAWHSVTHPEHGESDLVLIVERDQNQQLAVLIENKIDADPQPDQCRRYGVRGKAGIETGHWNNFKTCIIAPARYIDTTQDAGGYDCQVTYEAIVDFLRNLAGSPDRMAYKARILGEAIEQNRRGYCATPDPTVSQFWFDYWQLVATECPQLNMKRKESAPARSDWPAFRPKQIGKGQRIVHKLARGEVDLELSKVGEKIDELLALNQAILGEQYQLVVTGKSASIRAVVPPVDRFVDLGSQVDAVRAGLKAAMDLVELSHRVALP